MSLDRFKDAQAQVWPTPLQEIRTGRKQSHWMWFVFPQLRGLGRSPTALHYGIADLDEARAYLSDAVLGLRLIEISAAMLSHANIAPNAILGPVDALKLRSCATLFDHAGDNAVFRKVLEEFYDGEPCELTLSLIGTS